MNRDVGIGTVFRQVFADHEAELAVGIHAFPYQIDFAGDFKVAINLQPDQAAGVFREPEVDPCRRNGIGIRGFDIGHLARRGYRSDIADLHELRLDRPAAAGT